MKYFLLDIRQFHQVNCFHYKNWFCEVLHNLDLRGYDVQTMETLEVQRIFDGDR